MASMGSCDYKTNVGFNETFYDFITAYVDKKLPEKWHANWYVFLAMQLCVSYIHNLTLPLIC